MTLIVSTIAQGGGDDGEPGGVKSEAERRNAAEKDTSRMILISSTMAQGGGDDGEQGGAKGEAERRNAAELHTSRTTLISSTIAQGDDCSGGRRLWEAGWCGVRSGA